MNDKVIEQIIQVCDGYRVRILMPSLFNDAHLIFCEEYVSESRQWVPTRTTELAVKTDYSKQQMQVLMKKIAELELENRVLKEMIK